MTKTRIRPSRTCCVVLLVLLLFLAIGGAVVGAEGNVAAAASVSTPATDDTNNNNDCHAADGRAEEGSCAAVPAINDEDDDDDDDDEEEEEDDDEEEEEEDNDNDDNDSSKKVTDTEDEDDDEEDYHFCAGCDTDELWDAVGCGEYHQWEIKPVPTVDDYMDMRRAYVAVVGLEESTIPSNPINEHDGYHVGIAAKQAGPHKGRGVFATEFIPQGTTVWSGTQAASFATIVQFRDFLGELARTGTNPYNACDVLDWAYTEYDDDDEDWTMSVELDPAALCNNAVTPDQVNLGCDETGAGGAQACEEAFGSDVEEIALKDIQPGEELLCDYNKFEPDHEKGWAALGMQWEEWGAYNHTATTTENNEGGGETETENETTTATEGI